MLSEGNIAEYLKLAKELMEIDYELSMVSKLVEKSQSELDYNTLRQLQSYMSVVIQKMGELHGKKVELQRRIAQIEPRFIKFVDNVQEHINKLRELLRKMYHGKISLKDFWDNISIIKEKIPNMLDGLQKSKKIINKIKANASDEVRRFLEKKLSTINSTIDYLNRLAQFVSIDPTHILRFKRNLGKPIILEPDNEECIISEIYIDPKGEIYLEVSREQEITSSTLELLYKEIGFDFMASDIMDFRDKLLRRMHSRMGTYSLRPSQIKSFLREEGLIRSLTRETLEKLSPQFEIVGYAPITKIASVAGGFRIDKKFLTTDKKRLIRCPSVNSLPESVIGKVLQLENKYYLIVSQTFLPLIGRVLICLQQDKNGEPLPHIALMDRVFKILARKKDLNPEVQRYVARSLKLIQSRKNLDDVYWTLRILIMRAGLKTSRKITESNALRPSYLFSYCIQNGIPLLFPEIVSYYIYIIETDLVDIEGKEPKIKMPISPKPFFEAFNVRYLNMLIGNICHENLGVLSEENKLILVCAPPVPSELIKRKSEEYGIPLDFAQTASKLIRSLIYFGKIRSVTEYRSLLDELNVQLIIYNELVRSFDENDDLVAAHAFLLELMHTETR